MADNKRLTEEQKRRIAEAHRKAQTTRSQNAAASGASKAEKSAETRAASSAGSRSASAGKSGNTAAKSSGKKNPEKGPKKLSVKMKRTIRQSVAGVCLVSSLIIAAIPGDKSGRARAVDYPEPSESWGYTTDRSEARNADLSSNAFLNEKNAKEASGDVHPSMVIVTGDNGEAQLYKQYDYYVTSDSGEQIGVICGYSAKRLEGLSDLTIEDTAATGFRTVTVNDYDNAVADYRLTRFVIKDPTDTDISLYLVDETSGSEQPGSRRSKTTSEIRKYFESDFADRATEIAEAVEAYKSIPGNEHTNPSYSDLVAENLIQDKIVSLNQDDFPRYYCTDHSLDGNEMVKVNNTMTNTMEYVVRYTGSSIDPNSMDKNGYLYSTDPVNIQAISSDAFQGLKDLKNITLSQKIKYVGDSAFAGNKTLQSFDMGGVSYIGNHVFEGCTGLQSINFSDATSVIGNEAFRNCDSLSNVNFPKVDTIGFGAFSECDKLENVNLSNVSDATIGEYAFYNTPALKNVTFNDNNKLALGKAAFAVGEGTTSQALESFKFPHLLDHYESPSNGETDYSLDYCDTTTGTLVNYTSRIGDYILAGRQSLKDVTFYSLGSDSEEYIPYHTFMGCSGLQKCVFQDDRNDDGSRANREAPQLYINYDNRLFRDVSDPTFYVSGPEKLSSGDAATPRKTTWTAKTAETDFVPYQYRDTNGNLHCEIGVAEPNDTTGELEGYLYDLNLDRANKQASLKKCSFIPIGTTRDLDEFVIPGAVAEYKLTELEDNCLDEIKDHIINLKIEDGSISTIGSGVFQDCDKLKTVQMGDSVETIGENAFADNPLLEDVVLGKNVSTIGSNAFGNDPALEWVHWERPGNGVTNIAQDAFKTDSNKLYFEGDVRDGYLPFDFAMDTSHTINSQGTNICYVTNGGSSDYSRGLYLMKNRDSGDVTLIDTPHASELGDIIDKSMGLVPWEDQEAEEEILKASREIVLPKEVASIDVKNFIEKANPGNLRYLADTLDAGAEGTMAKEDLYSDPISNTAKYDDDSDKTKHKGDYHPGLFSSEIFDHNQLNQVNGDSRFSVDDEDLAKGNDWIISIAMPGVKEIPDYAFDSCENLQSVIIGPDCTKIGKNPFQGCMSLEPSGLVLENTSPLTYDQNGIIYEENGNGYKVITCLPTYVGAMDENTNPLLAQVNELNEEAFAGCTDINSIDFSALSELKDIPERAFDHCTALSKVTLPETLESIQEDAFANGAKTVTMTIPGDTNINPNAFEDDPKYSYEIYTNEDTLTAKTAKTAKGNITVKTIGSDYSLYFYNNDGKLIDAYTQKVAPGYNGNTPKPNPTPAAGTIESQLGQAFDHWELYRPSNLSLDQDHLFDNVNEDREYHAKYAPIYFDVLYVNDDMNQVLDHATDIIPGSRYTYNKGTPTSAYNPGKRFVGWNFTPAGYQEGDPIYADVKAQAVYSPDDIPEGWHHVQFMEDDGVTVFNEYDVQDGTYLHDVGKPEDSKTNPNQGYTFDRWIFIPNGYSFDTPIYDDVVIIAHFEYLEYKQPTPTQKPGTTATPTPTGPTPTPTKSASEDTAGYLVTVENGAGTGRHKAGEVVTITAYAATEGKTFDRWTTSNADIGFSNAYSVATTFIMPTHDVKVTATYKSANATPTVSGNNANTTATPTPSGNNNNNNNNNNGDSTSGNSSKTQPGNDNGNGNTEVRITSDTIDNNNKNLGTATVSGSTDNFVVKVTDSAAATAAVEQALRNAYGSRFQDLKYVGFDISLYDSTGTRLVTNANNLAVTITLPIPDELVPYAGNNKAGAVANGRLEDLDVKFTTIDGVPCMRFTATHFSPYTIYVDTQNLVRGVSDITPKTGDGIAPKWFLSAGMLSLSCVLLLWKDKKPVEKTRKR